MKKWILFVHRDACSIKNISDKYLPLLYEISANTYFVNIFYYLCADNKDLLSILYDSIRTSCSQYKGSKGMDTPPAEGTFIKQHITIQ